MTTAQQTALVYGLLGFCVVWGIVLVPQLISHYARFGRVLGRRVAATAAVTLYGCLAVAVVLLPLPGPGTNRLSQTVQLVPLQWVSDVGTELARHGEPSSHALFTLAFQQVAMNVLLFVPLGLFARLLWRRGLAGTVLLGFGASLAIEITQVTANFGTAPFVYRIFDVDDLLNNTAGALLGWVVAALFVALRRASAVAAAPAEPATVPVPVGRPRPAVPAGPAFAGRPVAPHAGLRAGPSARQR
ncbi:VanZ family protein [Prauserella muralis]|uniref:Antibiotic resistance protein VanZ n=1 Tax=Prauserella muralis TaxID=588067 RepID=A0A2V4B8R4_9PSEU|nr:VanZ family protein [Prauserella muralis]PXY31546.1 antibiotic resistance protein VanZ [Prauserella muralis]TWE14104.1 glycopeptide antibiotics resistance protein [Prauserella muralis]